MKNICLFFLCILLIAACNKKNTDASYSMSIHNLEDHNIIDDHFDMMGKKFERSSAYEMYAFEALRCEAWKAEMLNFYKILKSKTTAKRDHELLDSERDSYIKHIENHSYDDDMSGSLSSLDSTYIMTEGFKEKTIELMMRMKALNINPVFIFNRKKYSAKKIEKALESDNR